MILLLCRTVGGSTIVLCKASNLVFYDRGEENQDHLQNQFQTAYELNLSESSEKPVTESFFAKLSVLIYRFHKEHFKPGTLA